MAITFALMNWQEIASIGMILFWAILIIVIYNIIILAVRLFNTTDNQEKNIDTKKVEKKKDNKTKSNAKKVEKKSDSKNKKESTKKASKKENK